MQEREQMATKNVKVVAIFLIVMLLGYYQSWIFVIIYEMLSKETIDRQFLLPPPLLPPGLNQEVGPYFAVQSPKLIRKLEYLQSSNIEALSQKIRHRIYDLQFANCQGEKISCGAPTACELGCQIHYLINCLMIATSVNATLVPDFSNWPYKEKWDQVFQPLNPLGCQVDDSTVTVSWFKNHVFLAGPNSRRIIKAGLPVPKEIGLEIKHTLAEPLLWYISQLANFTLRLQPRTEERLQNLQSELAFPHPIAAVLLRRRDKIGEKKQPMESFDQYFNKMKKYFDAMDPFLTDTSTRRVFVSTDDPAVLKFLNKRYRPPRWEIFDGIGSSKLGEVEEIIKNVVLLANCDFVICTYSSEICRLVVELKVSRDVRASSSVQSLSSKYSFRGKEIRKLKFVLL